MRHAFAGHEVTTVQMQGWAGIKNGDLLVIAERAGFDLFILADKNLRYQQNLTTRKMAILELWTNHRPTLEKHFPLLRTTAESMKLGAYCTLETLTA